MESWSRVLGGLPPWLIVAFFSLFSGMVGFVCAVSLGYYGASPNTASLFTTAIGSLIGASVAVSGAIFVQRLKERADRLTALNQVLIPIFDCSIALGALNNLCIMKRKPHWNDAIQAFNVALEAYKLVKPTPTLPEQMNAHLRAHRIMLDFNFRDIANLIAVASKSHHDLDWRAAAAKCLETTNDLENLETQLKGMA